MMPLPSDYVLPPADYAPSPFSDYMPPPSHGGVNPAMLDLAAEGDLGCTPHGDGMSNPQVAPASSVTHTYHPKLDGELMLFWVCTDTNITCRADLQQTQQ